ncbi:hypothetical protein AB0M43_30890 [Longispora sp. NPDC051575]|uniref:hypothetical protein n=1 Tax=Longispora sp. NPDC051575 TaxID=3154943 RepID=UPI00342D40F2
MLLVPANVAVDHLALRGPLETDRIEDLQILSLVEALSLRGQVEHPVSVRRPLQDPPDRIVGQGEREHSVELTNLTFVDFRSDLAKVRQLGRRLADEIQARSDTLPHLTGRYVTVSSAGDPPPRSRKEIEVAVGLIASALQEDRGFVGEGLDLTNGFPQHMPPNGMYGSIEGVFVQVYPADQSLGMVPVIASCQAELPLAEIRESIRHRVAAKDDPRNEVLVMTLGLPDKPGYICPPDKWLFDFIVEHGPGLLPTPKHLDVVILHLWGTAEILLVYVRPGSTFLRHN